METHLEVRKPRLTYAQFVATQTPPSPLLVRSILERYIVEMDGAVVRFFQPRQLEGCP